MATRGSNPSTGKIFFFFSKMSHLVLGPNQLPIQLLLQFSPKGTAQLGREFDHSSPPSAEVKNEYSHTSTPPLCLDVHPC